MKQWYLVQFKPNAHHMAVRNLNRQGFETFLPMQETTRRKATRFETILKPLFPGYMFVGVDADSGPWRKINSTMGVSRLVSLDRRPRPLPVTLISGLMDRCDGSGKVIQPKALIAGDSVKLLSGPFANFIATVETIDAEQRIWVLMELMGQRTRLQVMREQLQFAK